MGNILFLSVRLLLCVQKKTARRVPDDPDLKDKAIFEFIVPVQKWVTEF